MSLATFIQASAHSLPMLADGSVQAICTSPPYFGLRSYQGEQAVEWPAVTFRLNEWVEPTTVPGCDPNCEHEWTDGPKRTQQPQRDHGANGDFGNGRGTEASRQGTSFAVTQGSYCARCGGWRGGLGMEPNPVAYIGHLILCLREWRRVLRSDGVIFCNLGDSYAGSGRGGNPDDSPFQKQRTNYGSLSVRDSRLSAPGLKPKDLLMIPAMFAIAARADGWYLRSAITWCKGNPMPESVRDRPAKATEQIFMLAKSARYFYDSDAVRVLANGTNGSNGSDKVTLKLTTNGATSGGFSGQSGQVPLHNEWTPYLILAALLTAKRVLVQQRDSDFRQILNVFQNPLNRGVGLTVLAGLLPMDAPAQVIADVFKHLGIIIADGDLQSEAELRIRLRSIQAAAVESDNASFTVEEPGKVIAKIIANAQAIRDTFTLDALPECFVNVDLVYKSVPLLECADACPGRGGNGLVTQAALEQFPFLVELAAQQGGGFVGHGFSCAVGSLATHYTTEQPTRRNLWDWWVVNSTPFPGAHFACWPEKLVEPMIKAGSRPGDTVLDPFSGSGTTCKVAVRLGRRAIGVDVSAEYLDTVTAERFGGGVQMELV